MNSASLGGAALKGLAKSGVEPLVVPMNNESCLQWFCRVAFWEGVSTVVLFGIAMPLKYSAGMPEAVTYVGWVHGLLFMLYLGFLAMASFKLSWTLKRVALFFIASLVPLAPFYVERSLRKEAVAG